MASLNIVCFLLFLSMFAYVWFGLCSCVCNDFDFGSFVCFFQRMGRLNVFVYV